MHVWYDRDDLVAFTVAEGAYAMPHADPGRADLLEVLGWSERQASEKGRMTIEISVWDDDVRLRAEIAARGYAELGSFGPECVYGITGEPPAATLPNGYRFAPFTPAMDDAYVEMHPDAWSTIAPSPYRRELHDVVTAMPLFDRDLVPIVAAPDGTLAAYCIGWFDPISASTEIEPLGTRPAFHGRGLAHAVMREVIHRSWARGARSVFVWTTDPRSTAHTNEPARRLYASSGMRPGRVLREYRLTL